MDVPHQCGIHRMDITTALHMASTVHMMVQYQALHPYHKPHDTVHLMQNVQALLDVHHTDH
jgi:hypothetical protein